MQQHRKLNLVSDVIFTPTEQKMINLISKKYYKVSLEDEEIEKKKEIETNEDIIEYFFKNRNDKENKKSKKLIDCFIK